MTENPSPKPNRPVHRPNSSPKQQSASRRSPSQSSNQNEKITETIKKTIDALDNLSEYNIRTLVEQAQKFGPYLRNQRPSLETNQIRKFLDAINQIKAKSLQHKNFVDIEDDIVLLKPKLAYAAARQSAIQALSDVISIAINKVHTPEDFKRLVQLIESIIAYHKAEGGK